MDQTVSFVVRFTQKIYQDESGEDNVQWRGKISHVQGGQQLNFTDFQDAVAFIQKNLKQLTIDSTTHRSKEDQEGILAKSYEIWKRMAKEGPKMFMDAIKDPKKQVAQFQDQLTQVSDELSHKIEIDDWRTASRTDFKKMTSILEQLQEDVSRLHLKVDNMSKPS